MFFRAAAFRADAFAAKFLGASSGGGPGPTPEIEPRPAPGGGKGRKHRRRILLSDGRILIPANDQEYRRAVEQIIANLDANEETAEPPKRKRVIKDAVVRPKVPKLAPVRTLPSEFYTRLEFHSRSVLNYLAIQSAWQAYEAQMDEEAVEMLLMVN